MAVSIGGHLPGESGDVAHQCITEGNPHRDPCPVVGLRHRVLITQALEDCEVFHGSGPLMCRLEAGNEVSHEPPQVGEFDPCCIAEGSEVRADAGQFLGVGALEAHEP